MYESEGEKRGITIEKEKEGNLKCNELDLCSMDPILQDNLMAISHECDPHTTNYTHECSMQGLCIIMPFTSNQSACNNDVCSP